MNDWKSALKESLRLAGIAFAVFVLGIMGGLIGYPLIKDQLPALLKDVFAGVMSGSTLDIIVKVFLRNFFATLIMLVLGITVIATVAIIAANGLLIGFVFRFAEDRGLNGSQMILGLLPHGVFELPALFLAAGAGMRIGWKLIESRGHRLKAASSAMREAAAVYLVIVVPLLIIAAIMEITVSRNLIK